MIKLKDLLPESISVDLANSTFKLKKSSYTVRKPIWIKLIKDLDKKLPKYNSDNKNDFNKAKKYIATEFKGTPSGIINNYALAYHSYRGDHIAYDEDITDAVIDMDRTYELSILKKDKRK